MGDDSASKGNDPVQPGSRYQLLSTAATDTVPVPPQTHGAADNILTICQTFCTFLRAAFMSTNVTFELSALAYLR